MAGTSPSDCLVSYIGHSLEGGLTPLQRSSRCILQTQLTGQVIILKFVNGFAKGAISIIQTIFGSYQSHYQGNLYAICKLKLFNI